MNKITEPIVLWRGSHQAGSGKGCAMNVVSWENGDTTITDFPDCSDRMLARIVQGVNDALAGEGGRLAPEEALIALRLGHATVGTSAHGLSDFDLKRVYVRCAVLAARKVVHLDKSGKALPAILAAETWAAVPTSENKLAADAAADAAYAAYAAAAAAYAYAYAYAARNNGDRLWRANLAQEIIDLFKELTGTGAPEPESRIVNDALRKMRAV